ncbi:MAG: sigma-70 family RNA polymerase sigma factor [Leptospirales bacterium]
MSKNDIDITTYYTSYGPMVLRRCRQLLGEEDRALDAMQDVFLLLLEKKDKIKYIYPSSLLYRIATNVCLNLIQKDQKVVNVENMEELMQIAKHSDMDEKLYIRDFLNKIFKNEYPSTREIAVMRFIDKMTYEQISTEVKLSVSGIRKRLRKLKENARRTEGEDYEQ